MSLDHMVERFSKGQEERKTTRQALLVTVFKVVAIALAASGVFAGHSWLSGPAPSRAPRVVLGSDYNFVLPASWVASDPDDNTRVDKQFELVEGSGVIFVGAANDREIQRYTEAECVEMAANAPGVNDGNGWLDDNGRCVVFAQADDGVEVSIQAMPTSAGHRLLYCLAFPGFGARTQDACKSVKESWKPASNPDKG